MNMDVLCIGPAVFDIFIESKSLKPNRLAFEDSISLNNNNTYNVDHTIYEMGGSGMNSAIVFARQGHSAGCISRTGMDYLASQMRQIAKSEKISTDFFVSKAEHHTDLNIHIVTDRANEISLDYKNSEISLRARDAKFPKIKPKLIYFAELPEDFRIFKYYATRSKALNCKLAINIKSIKNYKKRQLSFVMSSADTVLMPVRTAFSYFDKSFNPQQIIKQISGFGADSVVLYDVVNEAYAFENKTLYVSGSYKKTNPLDMTGSEDVFASAFMSSIMESKSVPESLTVASANACSVMEVFGTRIGILKKPALRTMKVETTKYE